MADQRLLREEESGILLVTMQRPENLNATNDG